jgi:hypothetical protein
MPDEKSKTSFFELFTHFDENSLSRWTFDKKILSRRGWEKA